jgi:transcription elongation factor Elf1
MPKEDDNLVYFTQRFVYARGDNRKDNWGETEHKVKVWVFNDEPKTANVEYSCPYCGHNDAKQIKQEKPLIVICDKCGKKIKVPKLK